MSKLREYSLSHIETNEIILERLFDNAMSFHDVVMFAQALSYSEGLTDAYDAMLMSRESNSIQLIVKKKSKEYLEEMSTDG